MPQAYCGKCARMSPYCLKTLRCVKCGKVIWELTAKQCSGVTYAALVRWGSK